MSTIQINTCLHQNNTPLRYYYDDDWGIRGSKVWYTDPNGNEQTGELTVCLDCGTVFVKPWNDIK